MAADYLQKRDNVYRFYRRVPDDIKPVVGKAFWRVSLKTGDAKIAEQRARAHAVTTDNTITQLRAKLAPLTQQDRAIITDAGGWEALRLATQGSAPASPSLATDLVLARAIAGMARAEAEWSARDCAADGIQATGRLDRAETAEAEAEALEARHSRNLAVLAKDRRLKLPRPTRSNIFSRYATNPQRETAARRFLELFPEITGLNQITRAHGATFVRELARLPLSNAAVVRNLPFTKAVELADRDNLRRLDRATIRFYFRRLSAMLNEAANEGAIPANPMAGYRFGKDTTLSRQEATRRQEDAKGFTPAEMRVLDAADMTPTIRWCFLISGYQGTRLEETAQLRRRDVFQGPGGVWCLRITDEGGRTVKNDQSRRVVPIHADLIERGFVTFATTGTDPDAPLFQDLQQANPKPGFRVGARVGTRFSAIAKALGIAKTFHGLRHGHKTACRNAGLPDDVSETLAGRMPTTGIGSRYGDLHDVRVLKPYLDRVKPFEDAGGQISPC